MRAIYEIAGEIEADWRKTKSIPTAKPYLEAMFSLTSIKDKYILDSGESVVAYFLSNASGWRGDTARRVKSELKEILKNA